MQTPSLERPIELLAPAGSPEALNAAVAEGADAVYLGLRSFNARLRSQNFAYSQFEAAVRILHKQRRRVYVTVNTVFEQREADRLYQFLKYLDGIGPDAIIVQDFGVAKLAQDNFPALRLHASTQMNIATAKGANALSRRGFSRVVLARELNLTEINDVRANTTMELEVFVHGALCVSVSGLCLFSSFLGGKSANRGLCTQACRRRYRFNSTDEPAGDLSPQALPDTEVAGYFFSPSDLQLADGLAALAEQGINSIKIEGRMKSAEYVGVVVAAYRRLIDALDGDRETALAEAIASLTHDFARPKTKFYWGGMDAADWLDPSQAGGTGLTLGKLKQIRQDSAGRLGLIQTGQVQLRVGDTVRFHRNDDSLRTSLKLKRLETTEAGLWIPLPEGFKLGDSVYLIQSRSLSKRYPALLPNDLSTFRRLPGRETAPSLAPRPVNRLTSGRQPNQAASWPKGFYVAVSELQDLYIVQAVRPVRVLLHYSAALAAGLLQPPSPLPFSKDQLVLVLDPFFSPTEDRRLSQELPSLIEAGFQQFIVNNLGQIALFREAPVRLAAGPYLYTFNRWAFDFLADYGLSAIVPPLEINRQNLERAIDPSRRNSTLVTVFAYPALFRIRANLSSLYQFDHFTDAQAGTFRLVSRPEGSVVYPEVPFSIVDKIPFLKNSGFDRFILDFSGPVLKKLDYKQVMEAAKNGRPLANTSRFNWKDGFFNPERVPVTSKSDDQGNLTASRAGRRPADRQRISRRSRPTGR